MPFFIRRILFLSLVITSLVPLPSFAWNHDSLKQYFRSPIDFPIALAGNFGELRYGHFHAGLDIRTGGVEGKRIYAVADGYVSRVEVSLGGYGKVIHITHNNGLKSVYAHLSHFKGDILKAIREEQLKNESFTCEIFPSQGSIPVKKGDVIALSGNTGGSAGPHLHFEIRNAENDVALNPLKHGFTIADTKRPKARTIGIYPLNEESAVRGKNEKLLINLNNASGSVTAPYPVKVHGKIGFGIEAYDYQNTSNFRCGLYRVKLFKNNTLVYQHTLDSVPFEVTRNVLCHIDYKERQQRKKKIQRSFILPNNRLDIYDTVVNRGEFFFLSNGTHKLRYELEDIYGNVTKVHFVVNSTEEKPSLPPSPKHHVAHFPFQQPNDFKNHEVWVSIPANALFEDLFFHYKTQPAIGRCVTSRYHIDELTTPLNDYIRLGINIADLDTSLQSKAVIVSLDNTSSVLAVEGGESLDGWVYVNTRSFGPYTVFLDTIPPRIKPLNLYENKVVTHQKTIDFIATDNLSGIDKIDARIDGKWVVMDYEPKTNRLSYLIEDSLQKGTHQWELTLIDSKGNQNSFNCSFRY